MQRVSRMKENNKKQNDLNINSASVTLLEICFYVSGHCRCCCCRRLRHRHRHRCWCFVWAFWLKRIRLMTSANSNVNLCMLHGAATWWQRCLLMTFHNNISTFLSFIYTLYTILDLRDEPEFIHKKCRFAATVHIRPWSSSSAWRSSSSLLWLFLLLSSSEAVLCVNIK